MMLDVFNILSVVRNMAIRELKEFILENYYRQIDFM